MKQNKKWFKKVRGSYLPNNIKGVLTYIPYLGYMIGVLIYVINNKDNFWEIIFFVVPNWLAACIVMTWVASHKS